MPRRARPHHAAVAGLSVPVAHLLEDLHREVTALGDVVLEHSLGLVASVRFQRAQDPGMVPRRDLGPLRDELEVPDGQTARQVPEHRCHPTRTAGLVDHLVELVVPVRLVLGVVGDDERLVDLAQLHELLVGERGGGPAPRQSRDEPEDPVVVDDVGALQPSHERALAAAPRR